MIAQQVHLLRVEQYLTLTILIFTVLIAFATVMAARFVITNLRLQERIVEELADKMSSCCRQLQREQSTQEAVTEELVRRAADELPPISYS